MSITTPKQPQWDRLAQQSKKRDWFIKKMMRVVENRLVNWGQKSPYIEGGVSLPVQRESSLLNLDN